MLLLIKVLADVVARNWLQYFWMIGLVLPARLKDSIDRNIRVSNTSSPEMS